MNGNKKGWRQESVRHSLARKGIKTAVKKKPKKVYTQVPESRKGTHFKINDKITVVARRGNTKNGFCHIADLYVDGVKVDSSKVSYLNRTWESYDYKTALTNVINKSKHLSDEEKNIGLAFAKDYEKVERERVKTKFATVGAIAKLGEVFGQTEKEKNVWKTRMLKAGLGKGISMPDDWDTLDETTKKERLDKVIKFLGEKKKR